MELHAKVCEARGVDYSNKEFGLLGFPISLEPLNTNFVLAWSITWVVPSVYITIRDGDCRPVLHHENSSLHVGQGAHFLGGGW